MIRVHQVSCDTFGPAFEWARSKSPLIRDATSPWDGGDSGTAYFISDDFRSGFAVTAERELRYVYALDKGRGEALLTQAVQVGADHLDCFDGYLPTFYARHGFVETSREPNYTPGGPDVVYMQR